MNECERIRVVRCQWRTQRSEPLAPLGRGEGPRRHRMSFNVSEEDDRAFYSNIVLTLLIWNPDQMMTVSCPCLQGRLQNVVMRPSQSARSLHRMRFEPVQKNIFPRTDILCRHGLIKMDEPWEDRMLHRYTPRCWPC